MNNPHWVLVCLMIFQAFCMYYGLIFMKFLWGWGNSFGLLWWTAFLSLPTSRGLTGSWVSWTEPCHGRRTRSQTETVALMFQLPRWALRHLKNHRPGRPFVANTRYTLRTFSLTNLQIFDMHDGIPFTRGLSGCSTLWSCRPWQNTKED